METKLEVTNLITPFINTFKTLNDEWKNLFDIGISEYLQAQTEKYFFTNTFIHRGEKVRFSDIYYPIKANYKKLTTDFQNLNDIFENYKNITIVGSAGSGKTTLLKHIFQHTIRTTKKIPILIELRNLNDFKGDFEKLIADKILKSKVKPNDDTFKRALESGSFLFLFDGYDEIFSTKKQEINRQIELFIDSYSKNNFLITTRPGSGIENFTRFCDFKICNLKDNDVKGFILKIVQEKERSGRILQIINDPKNNNYIEYLRNPLLLSMFIIAFENHPEIPAKKSSFYRNVFDTLYSRHDGITKNSFPREKLTNLQRDDFEKILNIFCYLSLIEGQYSFTEEYLTDLLKKVKNSTEYNYDVQNLIYDLRTTISILILDGFEYSFPHRSMQEYFTAQFICNLPSDKKAKAYNNMITALEASSTDESFSLWNICNELDNSAFTSYFLIPKLKSYEKALSVKSNIELLDVFFQLIEPAFHQKLSQGNGKELLIYRRMNFQSAFDGYCNIYDYELILNFPKTSGAESEILLLLDKKHSFQGFDTEIIKESNIKEVLIKFKICDIIKDYKKAISEKILFYEKEIKKNKSRIDDLLNI